MPSSCQCLYFYFYLFLSLIPLVFVCVADTLYALLEARMARAAAAATAPGGAGAAAALPPSSSLSASGGSADMGGVSGGDKPVMIVYYIGGVSWLEVQALRFLSNSADFPYQIIICTTKLLNGSTLIKSLIHQWDA